MSNHEERNEVRTYFKMIEISRWLGITPFEILINLVSFFIFSIFLTLTLDGNLDFFVIHHQHNNVTEHDVYRSDGYPKPQIDWFRLFSILFCADIMNAYFCFIVILRMYLQNMSCTCHKLFWTLNFILLTGLFKYLIALKLTGTSLEWTEVCSPIFVLLQLFALRACQIKNS